MRYKNLIVDLEDIDFLDEESGDLVLFGTDDLISITNDIRRDLGYTDLVEVEKDNDEYYNFYLMYNFIKQEISIQAVCNYGEKDEEVWYKLPMTAEEERGVLFFLIGYLHKLYK